MILVVHPDLLKRCTGRYSSIVEDQVLMAVRVSPFHSFSVPQWNPSRRLHRPLHAYWCCGDPPLLLRLELSCSPRAPWYVPAPPFWKVPPQKTGQYLAPPPVIITITASIYRLEGELRYLASLCLLPVLYLSNLVRSKVVGL